MGLVRHALIVAGVLTTAVCARDQSELVLVQRDAEAKPHAKKQETHRVAAASHHGSNSTSVKQKHRSAGALHVDAHKVNFAIHKQPTLVPLHGDAPLAAVPSPASQQAFAAVIAPKPTPAVYQPPAATGGSPGGSGAPYPFSVVAPASTTTPKETLPTVSAHLAGDPPPGLPKGSPAHEVFQCASNRAKGEDDCPECAMTTSCACEGYIRFGYPPAWSDWFPVTGVTDCSMERFGLDPLPGKGKVCMCYGEGRNVPVTLAAPLSGVGWPIFSVAAIAVVVSVSSTIAHGFNTFNNLGAGACELALQAGLPAIHIAPMICAIFVAVGMRAASLSPAHPSVFFVAKHKQGGHHEMTFHSFWASVNPAGGDEDPLAAFPGMKLAVSLVATAFIAQVVFRLYAEHLIVQAGTCQHAGAHEHWLRVKTWSRIHNATLLVMYLGIFVLLCGILTMRVNGADNWRFLPSMACTIALATCYFTAYGLLHILVTIPKPFGAAVMKLSALNLNFAPMICTMFLGLQVSADVAGKAVPSGVEAYMYVCVGTIVCQVLLGVATPFLFGAELERVGPNGEEDLVIRNKDGILTTSLLRWAVMVAMYIGIWKVCCAMWLFNAEPPRERLLCFLAAVYFQMYLLLWVALTARQMGKGGFQHTIRVFAEGTDMVSFCPMLAALVLAWWVY